MNAAGRLSALAAAATWVALLSWSVFLATPGRYQGPLLLIAALIVLLGIGARLLGASGPLAFAVQCLGAAAATSYAIVGSPIPLGDAGERLGSALTAARDTAQLYAPPVPDSVPGVEPLLILGGAGCLLLTEFMAVVLRRIPLAGLPLLLVVMVPLSITGDGPKWYVFAGAAALFLAMLSTHQDSRVSSWGRAVEPTHEGHGAIAPAGFNLTHARARALGAVVIGVAVLVPTVIPTASFGLFGFGPGSGSGGDIGISNPVVDLRRDLIQGDDNDLVTVVTDDPDPSYLRIAVLNRFSDEAWSPGDRRVPTSQRAFGPMPALEGVDADVPRTEYSYDLSATDRFKSTWLPTTQHISAIQAEGDWRFDLATRDFLAAPEDLTTESATWNFQGVELTLDAESLSQTSVAAGLVNSELTSLPAGLSPEVRDLAVSVTQRAPSRFEKAVALQSWFRGGGGFVYDISRPRGNSSDDLVAFLRDAPGGRTGYCEQFAASMAVMARILGIPARVAIGFLRPEGVGPQTWVYSAHDLHAWPELYFEGAGWVRFEPTPSARVSRVPRYTTQNLTPAIEPTPSASATGPAREDPIREPRVPEPEPTAAPDVAEESGGPGAGMLAGSALAGILIALAAMTPRAIRRRRRERRCAGGVEEVWAEIADTVRDLNLEWPRDRSPRETAATLAGWFGSPPDEFTPERPLRGPAVNPEAVVALERIVTALEVSRYAERDAGQAGGWSDDARACILALIGGTPRNTRRRAEWLPHSLWGRTKATSTTEEPTGGDSPTRPDLVDRVS